MGNQVTTLSQIYPVEYYLADYSNDLTFDNSLGSTRFMKVARVTHRDAGYCVAKIYAFSDPNININHYEKKLEHIRDAIKQSGETHSLPFSCCLKNEKCIILLRQYVKYNLYDRLSTRPFLSSIEKRWIAYQLLRSIQSLHNLSIFHGDIKSENILITSFLWVTLADFAFYKPVTLPENNPSDFSYFFDTSRRHCCNMAPERFVETTSGGIDMEPINHNYNNEYDTNQVTPQMDIFSVGCVLAELFSDDTPNSSILDLGQILMYRKNQYDPTNFLEDGIAEPQIRRLILNMIDLDPANRKSACYHLQQTVPSIFPGYFNLLYDFVVKLIPLSPDLRIFTLNKDLDRLSEEIITEYDQGLLIPLILVTSTLRSLESTDAKIVALKLCVRIVQSSTVMSDYIVDRLLPYVIQLMATSEPRVKAYCITSLNSILKQVDHLQPSDANIFIDYILPKLVPLSYDKSTLVRITLASNISELAQLSFGFLDPQVSDHELRLASLQESFGKTVERLLLDPNNHVKRSLLNENISKFCDFFGPERTEQLIFNHIHPFVSDKSDFRLRASFFDSIVDIGRSLGPNYAPVFKPLLQKGLADSEEIVIYKCVRAISSMTSLGLLTYTNTNTNTKSKDVIYELFQEAVPLLSFPNKWIRNSVIDFVLVLSKADQEIDFNRRILPAIKLHLNKELHGLRDEIVLYDSLQNPLPRVLIDSILNGQDDIDKTFDYITKRKLSREKKKYRNMGEQVDMESFDNQNDNSDQPSGAIRSLMELLTNVDQYSEDKLIDSELILRRIHKNKHNSSSRSIEPNISVRRHESTGPDLDAIKNIDPKYLMSSTEMCYGKSTRPKGILLAHLQEHKSSVNKLLVIPNSTHFASCSSDGTIKFWDSAGAAIKPQTLFRSKQTIISPDAGAITTISLCMGAGSLLSLSENNNLHLLPFSPGALTRQIKTVNFDRDLVEPEQVTDLVSLSNYTYATSSTSSHLRGYDLRLPTNSHVWSLKVDGKDGLITCMDGNELCITCGTSSSVIAMFDLRFYIRATSMSYPPFQDKMKKRIRRILLRNEDIYCSVDGNNEVSSWHCESATRTKTLWASPAPCLSSTRTSHNSVLAMLVDESKDSHSIVTAGDDMKIRFWDLNEAHRSYFVSRQGTGNKDQFSCQLKLVDGIQVYQEKLDSFESGGGGNIGNSSSSTSSHLSTQTIQHQQQQQQQLQMMMGPPTSHHDSISCLANQQNLLLSASKDGVIKIWR